MLVQIKNLDFTYFGSAEKVFDKVSFSFDTNWRTGLIGRNGTGKTTFFKILTSELEYNGTIISPTDFYMFPFDVNSEDTVVSKLYQNNTLNIDYWKIKREFNLLKLHENIFNRPFNTLSKGEQTKVKLAILFAIEDAFLLIDEPTSHLDIFGRETVSKYLNRKKGFVLISHDRNFINSCVDHIISFNRNSIDVQAGNFDSWENNKKKEDAFEIKEYKEKCKGIVKLSKAIQQKALWAGITEKNKKQNTNSGMTKDKGYIGHKSAKMMRTVKNIKKRREREFDEKEKLLKNIDKSPELKLNHIKHYRNPLIEISNLSCSINDEIIFSDINLCLSSGECLAIQGGNGSGKSSLIKIILGEINSYTGRVDLAPNLKISYIQQDSKKLQGSLKSWAADNEIDESLFKTVLNHLDFSAIQFDLDIENYSEGQKRKVLLATSLSKEAHIFIWDEPLNYIDILSRIQIENLILSYKPTMIVIEHDKAFIKNVATRILEL